MYKYSKKRDFLLDKNKYLCKNYPEGNLHRVVAWWSIPIEEIIWVILQNWAEGSAPQKGFGLEAFTAASRKIPKNGIWR
jgi:hypothetical protein